MDSHPHPGVWSTRWWSLHLTRFLLSALVASPAHNVQVKLPHCILSKQEKRVQVCVCVEWGSNSWTRETIPDKLFEWLERLRLSGGPLGSYRFFLPSPFSIPPPLAERRNLIDYRKLQTLITNSPRGPFVAIFPITHSHSSSLPLSLSPRWFIQMLSADLGEQRWYIKSLV